MRARARKNARTIGNYLLAAGGVGTAFILERVLETKDTVTKEGMSSPAQLTAGIVAAVGGCVRVGAALAERNYCIRCEREEDGLKCCQSLDSQRPG